ncbi:HI1506-related protein [Pseudomonas guariconensis]|uniref:HI1506-related protein n=1 Tax=Pseudomonas guariconensis TaxID=1288410 RepID=UPI002B05B10F|nr:HI1506-related protein [Pseudomonas guariconensis]
MAMGTVIKAKRDGFRRAGLVHRVAGTFYPDGDLSERQLEVLRRDPHLLVVEGVQEDALQADTDHERLVQEMGDTIAQLEHDLGQARAGLQAATRDLVVVLERQKHAPVLILNDVRALEPADPAAQAVICIAQDTLAEIISQHLQNGQGATEANNDGSNPTLDNSGNAEASASPATLPPTAPSPGPGAEPVKETKPAGKRGGADKAEKKGSGE